MRIVLLEILLLRDEWERRSGMMGAGECEFDDVVNGVGDSDGACLFEDGGIGGGVDDDDVCAFCGRLGSVFVFVTRLPAKPLRRFSVKLI